MLRGVDGVLQCLRFVAAGSDDGKFDEGELHGLAVLPAGSTEGLAALLIEGRLLMWDGVDS